MTFTDYWNNSTPMKFDEEKWTYEQKRTFRYDLQSYMLNTFKFRRFKDKKVLEIGCGAGIDSVELATYGAIVDAIDFTDTAVNLTKELAKEANVSINVQKADATKLPFNSGTFDMVYSYGVIHHIPKVDDVLLEIQRVLKPYGIFMGMVYNKDSLLHDYSIIHLHEDEELTDFELTSKYSERNVGCPFTFARTYDELKSLLSTYFTSVGICTRYNVIDTEYKRKVKVCLPEGHPLGWHLCFEAVK